MRLLQVIGSMLEHIQSAGVLVTPPKAWWVCLLGCQSPLGWMLMLGISLDLGCIVYVASRCL